ncbi:MAG TPA: GNAT family N-acetyltransferase [Gaiellaceae bacterium]|nr:GNAT family N-acetyltransferase [Gaiellaceae bacterium]HVC25392.1 GNAT family N-acetyltransferase [Acidimicrobiales bacterium]
MDDEKTRVDDNPEELRYELWTDGALAGFISYTLGDGEITLVHTEVEPALEGRGLGSALVAGALDDVRARGLKLRSLCPFVVAYLRRHPELADPLA